VTTGSGENGTKGGHNLEEWFAGTKGKVRKKKKEKPKKGGREKKNNILGTSD